MNPGSPHLGALPPSVAAPLSPESGGDLSSGARRSLPGPCSEINQRPIPVRKGER